MLILVNAAFAGSEIALISLSEGQVYALETRGGAGRRAAALARDPNRFLSTIQVGLTLAGFFASATAAVTLAQPVEPALGFLGGAARPASVVLVTLALAYVMLVAGELTPKRLAMQRPEGWALVAAAPLVAMGAVSRPVIWLLSRSTNVAVRLMGGDPTLVREAVTSEELRLMIEQQATISAEQREVLSGTLEAGERLLRAVMVPRTAVFTVDARMPTAEAARALAEAGYQRAPAVDGDLDHAVGIVELPVLMRTREGTARDHAREAFAAPETLPVLRALREMQAAREKIALVVDEHGGIEGIVTIEDLVEELVGEIFDRYDRDVLGVRHLPDGALEVTGRFPVHDLRDVGVDLPERAEDYTTVGGLVMAELGRVARDGDRVAVDGWVLTVLRTRGTAIQAVRIAPSGPAPSGTARAAPST